MSVSMPRAALLRGGDPGLKLVSLYGYYTLISFLLNAFAVPPPPDAAPMWAGS
jgi:hypothetical protein